MSSSVLELKAKIYDELVKKTVAERNIAILEQQLQQVPQEPVQVSPAIPEEPAVSLVPPPHNNT